jgi:hypothetical protein
LGNGDLIISTQKDIRILDPITKLEKIKKNITTNKGKIYISKGYSNYVDIGSSLYYYVLQEFTDGLEFIGTKNEFPFAAPLHYSKGRLFNDDRYSDDGGKTWQQLTTFSSYNYNFNIGKNGYIFGRFDSKFVYSDDNGETSKVLNEDNLSWVTCDSSGNFIRTYINCLNGRKNQISFDNGAQWRNISCAIDNQTYAHSVVAGIQGNLISRDHCGMYLAYKKTEDTWQTGKDRFGSYIDQYSQTALPNGGVFFSDNQKDFVIKASFDSVTICNFFKTYYNNVYVKSNKLFIVEGEKILHTSDDFLNIKSSKNFVHNNTYKSYPTGNGKILQTGSYGMRLVDPETNNVKSINIKGGSALGTSYNGKNIYVLSVAPSSLQNKAVVLFHNSTDEGSTFFTDTILRDVNNSFEKLVVDHHENIYLLSNNLLLASFNQGNTWKDITPKDSSIQYMTDISISFDNFIYVATHGGGILRSILPDSELSRLIKVKANRDNNFNCLYDSADVKQVVGVVVMSDGRFRPLDSNGEAYVFYTTDSTSVSLGHNRIFSEVCEKKLIIKDYHPDSTINFNLKIYQDCADLKFGLTAMTLRRCFKNSYHGNITNEGNETSKNGIIHITLDSFYIFKSSNLEVLSYFHPELELKIPDLKVGEKLSFDILFELSCEAELGQEHCISAYINNDNECAKT